MFGEKPIKIPTISNIVESNIKEFKNTLTVDDRFTMTWEELMKYGSIKEDVLQDDDNTTITRSFVATDGTLSRTSKLIIPTDDYKRYMKETNIIKIREEIYGLEQEMHEYRRAHAFEVCANIRDQISFLRDKFNIPKKENE